MDRETFTATILAFKQRAPFRPFTVVTVSGNRHEVDHADALAVNDGVALFAGPGGDRRPFRPRPEAQGPSQRLKLGAARIRVIHSCSGPM